MPQMSRRHGLYSRSNGLDNWIPNDGECIDGMFSGPLDSPHLLKFPNDEAPREAADLVFSDDVVQSSV